MRSRPTPTLLKNDSMNSIRLLERMLQQFEARHHRKPRQIVLTPMALLAMAVKAEAIPVVSSVRVTAREIEQNEATVVSSEAVSLGVFVRPDGKTGQIVSCDLKA